MPDCTIRSPASWGDRRRAVYPDHRGFLGIVTKTGAIDAGIERVTTKLRGREEWMIPILMALFAAGGTIYGMAEESLPFYTLLVPVMLAARFDPVVAASTVLLGAGIGTLGSTINPFATVIAANAAGIPSPMGSCCASRCWSSAGSSAWRG